MRVKLGEQLVRENKVTEEQVQEALHHQKANGGKIGKALVALGFIKDEEITSLLSRRYGMAMVGSNDLEEVDAATLKIIPAETARKYQVLPLSVSGATLTLALADPTNVFAVDDIKFMTGYKVDPRVVSPTLLDRAIEKYYGPPKPAGGNAANGTALKEVLGLRGLTREDMASVGLSEIDLDSMSDFGEPETPLKRSHDEIDLGTLSKSANANPVAKLVNVIFVDALKRGASDIHIEPYEKEFRVRFRIDGILYNVMALPMKLRGPITSRVKTMARLDASEERLPQTGRIRIKLRIEDRGRDLDFGVSCLSTRWGEKIVLRLLDKSKLILDMTKLGFESSALELFKHALSRPWGLVLVTGPTGSGKTNTLYSAIANLNKPDLNIMTAEALVRFDLPGLNQVQIRESIGLTLPAVLLSFLRQDANVVMVDEAVDAVTSTAVVKSAARYGHLLLAATNDLDAASAVSSLTRACGQSHLAAGTLTLVVAQRLLRRVCTSCKVEIDDMPAEFLLGIGVIPEQVGTFKVYRGEGCDACHGTGYRGRVGLFEVMEISDGIRDLIVVDATRYEIRRKAFEEGMLSLRMCGIEKIKAGITTVEEVLRETVL